MIDDFFFGLYGSAKYIFRRSTHSIICGSILFLVQLLFCFPLFVGRDRGQEPESNGGVKSTGGWRRGGGRRDSQRGQELGGMGKISQHWHNISQAEKWKAGRSTPPPPPHYCFCAWLCMIISIKQKRKKLNQA